MKGFITVLSVGAFCLAASAAEAQVTVLTGSVQANECSAVAKRGLPAPEMIAVCSVAIDHEGLTGRDLAGTYVNRGVLYLRQHDLKDARRDFDTAASIAPTLGEAFVDRGASLIAQHRWAEGVADIDRGIALAPEEPEKAYFNRAIAKEHLDDMKGAYFDYRRAAEIAPAWPAPRVELERFTVAPKTAG